jgi:hypothetical protein
MLRIAIASAAICFVSSAALSAETWKCAYHLNDGPPGLSGQGTIEIDGNDLTWTLPAHPMPSVNGYIGAAVSDFSVLKNNRFGLVAASPQLRNDKDVGRVISAVVMVLNKSNGALREGAVSLNGSSDALMGTCRHS